MPSFAERLTSLLPECYRQNDATGDLATLLAVVGPSLDALAAAIDGVPSLAAARTCPADFLPLLAALLGVTYDPTGDPARQRQAIGEAVERYRRTGILTALQRDLRELGWSGTVEETSRAVTRLNRRGRLNRGKLTGEYYSLGVFALADAPWSDAFFSAVQRHQPAGTRVWMRTWTLVSVQQDVAPSLDLCFTWLLGQTASRFRLNNSRLNTQAPLTTAIAVGSSLTV
ncbi:MAG: Phage tail protein (Tail_P2_I) [bacterium ADurb.Bin429]|nr:MAG: Phage tail protein (Tail_P2_I) [bacterium ADurb.Bin429]